tara:strand:+ start:139 stop:1020 length:882 start_codon:yes stop_codon:yes gene_type:complete
MISKPRNIKAYYELTKPRLSLMSVLTAALGFLLVGANFDTLSFIGLCIGTALAAGGSAALNQLIEIKQDAIMARTKNRPLIKKEVSPTSVFFFGVFLSAQGIGLLYFTTNLWATLLTALTLFLYLVVYTPLKRKTIYSTEIGALSGALPPLIGWCAANGEPSLYGFILFAILFAWQMPHFMAIAYNHKKDYAKAGFKLQYEGEKQDFYLSRKSLIYGLVLTTLVFYPFSVDLGNNTPGAFYFLSACLLSVVLLIKCIKFYTNSKKNKSARSLFIVTIIYLPLLLLTMVIDHYI